jgi:DNA-binding GntR family transcriptional regulator
MAAGVFDRDAGTVWRQVAADMARRIRGGEWDGRLPSERDLAFEYEIALVTLRKALRQLREDGLVETEPGWGSRVVHGAPPPQEGPREP